MKEEFLVALITRIMGEVCDRGNVTNNLTKQQTQTVRNKQKIF